MKPTTINQSIKPTNRKRTTLLLMLGGYLNTLVLIIQGVLLIPLFIRFIGAHTYGLWLASGGMLAMLGMVNFGISNMLVQRVANAYGQSDMTKAGAYFVNGMYVYGIITTVFLIIGFGFSYSASWFFDLSSTNQSMFIFSLQLAVITAALTILNECLRGFIYAMQRPLITIILTIVFRIIGIVLTIWMLYENFGLISIPAGILITELLIFIASTLQSAKILRKFGIKVSKDKSIITEYFNVGTSLFLSKLGAVASRESDPLVITFFLRPEITAAYMVTRKAADVVFLVISIVNSSFYNTFSHLAGERNDIKTAEIGTKFISLIFILALIGYVLYVAVNQSFVALWVGETFALNQQVILWIGLAFFTMIIRNSVLHLLNGLGDFTFTSHVTAAEGLARVLLSILFICILGLKGVAVSLFLTSTISAIVLGIKLSRMIQFNISKVQITKASMLTMTFFITAEWFTYYNSIDSWVVLVSTSAVIAITITAFTALMFLRLKYLKIKLPFI